MTQLKTRLEKLELRNPTVDESDVHKLSDEQLQAIIIRGVRRAQEENKETKGARSIYGYVFTVAKSNGIERREFAHTKPYLEHGEREIAREAIMLPEVVANELIAKDKALGIFQ